MNSNKMDNQQLRNLNLGYLIGIIDGEGSIILSKSVKKTGSVKYRPRISISNTNKFLIGYIKNILNLFDIPYCEYVQDKRQHQNHKTYYLHISKLDGIKKCLNMIRRNIVGKKRKAKILYYVVNNWYEIESGKKEQAFQLLKSLNKRVPKNA